ncbi:MAG: hypothetical protein N3A54_04010 [Patescibacteria group bacterium]|nr:hypothetical protein [Patescibacteria group bacterium]
MNKDAVFASVIGFTVGLSITGGIIFGPRIVKYVQEQFNNTNTLSSNQTSEPTPSKQELAENSNEPNLTNLTIETPNNETITTDPSIKIIGKAQKESLVIVGSSEDEKIISVPDTGRFETLISLKEGKNDISVANLVNEKFIIERLIVYYTQEK